MSIVTMVSKILSNIQLISRLKIYEDSERFLFWTVAHTTILLWK